MNIKINTAMFLSIALLLYIIVMSHGFVGSYSEHCDKPYTLGEFIEMLVLMVLIWIGGYMSNSKNRILMLSNGKSRPIDNYIHQIKEFSDIRPGQLEDDVNQFLSRMPPADFVSMHPTPVGVIIMFKVAKPK